MLKAGIEIDKSACERVLLFLPHLTEHRKNIQVLTDEELESIKQLLNSESLSLRDNAILNLLLYTGLRGIDIVRLNLQSIDWNRDCIKLVQSKTKTELELPLVPIVGNVLYDYILTERPHCNYNTLFISEVVPYESIKVQTIRWIVRKAFKLANIRTNKRDRIGTHLFRHNITTKLLENNTALPVISDILGHASPRSVEPYLHADFLHLKECALSIDEYPVRQEVFSID
ncbi:tyrosine-type recombinase/integrase [Acetivibrio ethanolgignens]|uniref:tyrosine-type recombinase/integrase n=1 Tax=Acetivibrio ethanolgignens TaxID=290052 RepID=UPI00155E038C|nr:tyrosine-type recombinase/integrase [Acetivibrio ethanolgignens]